MPSAKPIIFTRHARLRMQERGAREQDVRAAVRTGQREPAQRGPSAYRLQVDFKREWRGRYYDVQEIEAIAAEEDASIVVVTVYTFYSRGRDRR
jgi:hypothetical protein